MLDDQALVLNVAGKGLVVITGCGHAGIVNICRQRAAAHRGPAAVGGARRVPPKRAAVRG